MQAITARIQRRVRLMAGALLVSAMWCRLAIAEPVPAFDFSTLLKSSNLVAALEPLEQPGQCRVLAVYLGDAAKAGDVISLRADTDNFELLAALKGRQPICAFLKWSPDNRTEFRLANRYYG